MPKFERTVEINAPVEKVWAVITDPEQWSKWFPGMESVSAASPANEGSSFEFTSKGKTGKAAIVKMEPMKHLQVMTQIGDDRDSHVFELSPSGGFFGMNADECKVDYTFDTLSGGGILGNFIAGGNPADALKVKNATNNLRNVVEGTR